MQRMTMSTPIPAGLTLTDGTWLNCGVPSSCVTLFDSAISHSLPRLDRGFANSFDKGMNTCALRNVQSGHKNAFFSPSHLRRFQCSLPNGLILKNTKPPTGWL